MNGRRSRERRRATPPLPPRLRKQLEHARADRDASIVAARAQRARALVEADRVHAREQRLAWHRFETRKAAIETKARELAGGDVALEVVQTVAIEDEWFSSSEQETRETYERAKAVLEPMPIAEHVRELVDVEAELLALERRRLRWIPWTPSWFAERRLRLRYDELVQRDARGHAEEAA